MVDAGGSDAHWTNGYKWALNTAKMLADYDVHWFEEALTPDSLEDFVKLREHSPVPDPAARCSRAARLSSPSSKPAPSTSSSPT
jgi:hypothetical protein